MKALSVLSGALALAVLPFATALAVDVINEDATPHKLTVEDENGQRTIEVGPGAHLQNVCGTCAIMIKIDDPMEAQGNEIVWIKDGQLEIRS